MNFDPKRRALMADVEAARQRIQRQMEEDADHEVALAMFRADLRRAKEALLAHDEALVALPSVRRYVDGRLAA